ncbi:MAG: hypothetical protein GY699_08690 [Desulfobacteraceae bacterium]|nr:hypothetical protein [Desulfobacteraceae bacterium]
MKNFFKQGKIDPIFCSPKEITLVEQKIEEYMEWVKIHKGNEHNLKLLLQDNPYFISDSDVTSIKSQLKSAKGVKKEATSKESNVQKDLLFLKMAQLCDHQNEDIDLKLKDLDKTKDELISTLRGIDNSLAQTNDTNLHDNKDTGGIMTRERISSWSRYLLYKQVLNTQENTPLFITTSEAVFNYMESNCKDVVNALDIDKIKVHENDCENKSEWHHQFCDYLRYVIQDKSHRGNNVPVVNDGCSLLGQVKLSFFSGSEINELFNLSDKQIPVCLIKLK